MSSVVVVSQGPPGCDSSSCAFCHATTQQPCLAMAAEHSVGSWAPDDQTTSFMKAEYWEPPCRRRRTLERTSGNSSAASTSGRSSLSGYHPTPAPSAPQPLVADLSAMLDRLTERHTARGACGLPAKDRLSSNALSDLCASVAASPSSSDCCYRDEAAGGSWPPRTQARDLSSVSACLPHARRIDRHAACNVTDKQTDGRTDADSCGSPTRWPTEQQSIRLPASCTREWGTGWQGAGEQHLREVAVFRQAAPHGRRFDGAAGRLAAGGHSHMVCDVKFSPCGAHLASVGVAKQVRAKHPSVCLVCP
jgi:hypothetical protein